MGYRAPRCAVGVFLSMHYLQLFKSKLESSSRGARAALDECGADLLCSVIVVKGDCHYGPCSSIHPGQLSIKKTAVESSAMVCLRQTSCVPGEDSFRPRGATVCIDCSIGSARGLGCKISGELRPRLPSGSGVLW